jgi:predicted secreted protein
MAVIVANSGTGTSGTNFSYNTIAVGEVTNLSFDGFSVSTVESTSIASAYKTFLPGVITPGTISCDVYSNGADNGQDGVKAAVTARTSNAFAIAFSDGSSVSGTAIVTGYSIKAATDSIITASISLQCTGTITIT